jgi:hypothetical protein
LRFLGSAAIQRRAVVVCFFVTMTNDKNDGAARNIHALLRSGRLPRHAPTQVWAGYGRGSDECRLCGGLIQSREVVMEAVFGTEGGTSLFFHMECFYTVEVEWRGLQRTPTPEDVDGASE